MMLADMGAEVIRVDRPGGNMFSGAKADLLGRNRKSIAVDLKHPDGVATVLRLVEQADALLEGFRPGVMERLGLGPDVCLARNKKLIYGRMTGWGQDGPMAQAAGHDINYIALAGALHAIGEKGGKPIPPLNLVGDFGGGGMFLAFGMVCGLLEAQKSGLGQVIDCSMVEGSAVLMGMFYAMHQAGMWKDERGSNMLDGASHYYNTYETADGKWVSVGAMEPQFYATLVRETGADPELFKNQHDAQSLAAAESRTGPHLQDQNPRRMVARCSKAATPASRPCCRWPRRPTIRTTWRARASSRSTACCTRHRRPASAAPGRKSNTARGRSAPTPTRFLPTGVSAPQKLRSF